MAACAHANLALTIDRDAMITSSVNFVTVGVPFKRRQCRYGNSASRIPTSFVSFTYRSRTGFGLCLSLAAAKPGWIISHPGDAVLIAPVSTRIPCYQGIKQGILRFRGSETKFRSKKRLRCSVFPLNPLRKLTGKIFRGTGKFLTGTENFRAFRCRSRTDRPGSLHPSFDAPSHDPADLGVRSRSAQSSGISSGASISWSPTLMLIVSTARPLVKQN
jgi:hypothetical protein